MKCAIFTMPGDYHSYAVQWGLSQHNVTCDLILIGDLPQLAKLTVWPGSGRSIDSFTDEDHVNLLEYDRIWLRRPSDAILPDDLHPADRHIAREYWTFTIEGVLRTLAQHNIFCVNSAIANDVSRFKVVQLMTAHDVGLITPACIITNDGNEAAAFIRSNEADGKTTILKGVYSSLWEMGDGGAAVLDTRHIRADQIDNESLQLAPCVFQEEIPKAYEARVIVMGMSVFAAKLESQNVPGATVDFRLAKDWGDLGCEPLAIPSSVRDPLLAFQRALGLNFGVFDFIIDRTGQWIFLETNPMGQFLWVENVDQRNTVLDAFVEFLISSADDFQYSAKPLAEISTANFFKENPDFATVRAPRERQDHISYCPPYRDDEYISGGA